MDDLVANLIVFILLGGVLTFVISVVVHSKREERKNKQSQNRENITIQNKNK